MSGVEYGGAWWIGVEWGGFSSVELGLRLAIRYHTDMSLILSQTNTNIDFKFDLKLIPI